MLILPPKDVSREINQRLRVINRRVNLPHLTLGESFHSTPRDVELSLRKSLRSIDPFEIQLNKIGLFYDKVLFLTPDDDEDIDQIENLLNRTRVSGNKSKREMEFVPHLTLTKKELSGSDRELLKEAFSKPIDLPIDRVSIFRAGRGGWQKFREFGLGKTS